MGFLSQILLLGAAGWTAYNMAESIRYHERDMIIGRGAMVAMLLSMVLAMHAPTYGMMLALGLVSIVSLVVLIVVSRRVDYY